MKRSDFLKSIIGGAVVAAISPMLLAEESIATIPVEVDALKPYCYSFKVTKELWDRCTDDDGDLSIKYLDDLCIDLTGYPIKEVGYVDDDFAKNYYTVVSFRAEIENEKQHERNNLDTQLCIQ